MQTRVIVLAAGKGKRMGADVPKALVEIAGRPMIDHLLDSIRDSEVDPRPIIVVAPDTLEIFNNICSDRDCEYAIQEEQLGTGNAVLSAREAANGAEAIIVLYGDHPFISDEVILNLSEMHNQGEAMITMLTTKVPNYKGDYAGFNGWGRIIRNELGHLEAIREAKDATEEELKIREINPSLYAFNAQWLWEHLPELQNKNASGEYYLTDLVEMAIDEGSEVITASAEPFEVVGINTPEELETAERMAG
ncbi:MAG: NTP transferase domain-containing protein [Candidatus Uhrbacteria bacterium]|nr:NTP transferase domain-containing protein [Candidatus Uhrbacteria bacterium]